MLNRLLSFLIALFVIILFPASASAELTAKYDEFSNDFIISSKHTMWMNSEKTQQLLVSFNKTYFLGDERYYDKKTKSQIGICDIGFIIVGKDYYFFNDTAYYLVPNSQGKTFRFDKTGSDAPSEVVSSRAWGFVSEYHDLYKDIPANEELSFKINFRNQAPFVFTVPPEIMQEWHKVFAFDYTAEANKLRVAYEKSQEKQ